jgi:hypothetical protein
MRERHGLAGHSAWGRARRRARDDKRIHLRDADAGDSASGEAPRVAPKALVEAQVQAAMGAGA